MNALGVQHPVVLGPYGGLSSVELTAAVSELGGLGSFGLYGYDAARIRDTVRELRARTTHPFAVNLWLPTGDEVAPRDIDYAAAVEALAPYFDELGLPLPPEPERFIPDFAQQWAAVLEAAPPVVSFVFGVPPREVVESAKQRGMLVLGTATTVREALALEQGGVDAVVATGFEAGGHRVAFLRPVQQSLVGTFALVPQVVDAVQVPVIAAGGIADRRGVAAALALGASAVQVGTAFLATTESAANDVHRTAIRDADPDDTVLTRAMSGRLARGLPTRVIRSIETSGSIAPFPAQNWITGRFRPEAAARGIGELQSLWMGQAAALSRHSRAADVFEELLAGVPGHK